jgi:hypothetical protein
MNSAFAIIYLLLLRYLCLHYQNTILDAFEKILEYNGYDDVELYFKTLQPLEFTNLENAITEEEIEQQTGQK